MIVVLWQSNINQAVVENACVRALPRYTIIKTTCCSNLQLNLIVMILLLLLLLLILILLLLLPLLLLLLLLVLLFLLFFILHPSSGSVRDIW